MPRPHSTAGQRRSAFGASLLVLCLVTRNDLVAQDVTLASTGNATGGDPYTITRGAKVLVGVRGRIGSFFVDGLQVLCVGLKADGTWAGSPTEGNVAGSGIADKTSVAQCPLNSAVTGLQIGTGNTLGVVGVDGVAILCAPLGEWGQSAGSGTVGGSLRYAPTFPATSCANGMSGKALTGRAHDWIDALALICGRPGDFELPGVNAIATSASSTIGGNPLNGTVTLNAMAIKNTQVTMSISNTVGTFATNPIIVASGQKSAFFVLNTRAVPESTSVTISASPEIGLRTATVIVRPPQLKSLSLSAAAVLPGTPVTGTVDLTGIAFQGGLALQLSSGNSTAVVVPATAIIAEGRSSATFPVTTNGSKGAVCSVLTATYAGVSATAQLTVLGLNKGAFTLAGRTGATRATVTFPTVSLTARTLSLTSSDARAVAVPVSIVVPAGSASASFTMTPGSGAAPTCSVVTATDVSGSSAIVVSVSGGLVGPVS